MRILRLGPEYCLASSEASYCLQVLESGPKYPVRAFRPQGEAVGLQIGAKAEIERNMCGLRRPMTNAPR